jgi:phosphotransferase system HPr (HPr) family protein
VIEREIEIVNQLGLHARAAAKFVHLAGQYPCDVEVELDGRQVDAKSILGLLLLAAPVGTVLIVRCNGLQEDVALAAIADLFAERFGEAE